MPPATIPNPILNSPYREPNRHFRFDDDGITDNIVERRRLSGYFVPIPQPRKKGAQLSFGTEWTDGRFKETEFINRIRDRVGRWREGGHVGVTGVTRRLLEYWTDPARDKPLFFCQIEAVETAIYLAEVARKFGDAWMEAELRAANDAHNPGLTRVAFKMATGSGKTLVMAMLIAWQALNKLHDRQDVRFSDAFLIVTPGITIRDRLRVLLPTDPDNYYRQRDILPPDQSRQLESGEGMSAEFKKIAAVEIEEFKADYRARFPGRDADDLRDEDLLREVMNTVGKPGKLGEHIRCVVSVSMLTEGWDANTVTHILGVRAFGTQLLCEQVVGRGLRRRSYATNEEGLFEAEYAEVYGVPFSFISTTGEGADPKPPRLSTRVRALEDRAGCEITFPRVTGYRYDIPPEHLTATFTSDAWYALSTESIATVTELRPVVGEESVHTLDDLRRRRLNEVAFLLAKLTLERYFPGDDAADDTAAGDGPPRPSLFPQILSITKRWLSECLDTKDQTFPQLLLLAEFAHDAADRIYRAIVSGAQQAPRLRPILRAYDVVGSTRYVDFDTIRPVWNTRADKCHISHVVADTGAWEQKVAQVLEDLPEVRCYAKNHNLGLVIPYTLNGEERLYYPDFVARVDDGHGPEDLLNLLIEVSGEARMDKAAKVATARTLWVPAVNNHGGFGRWAFAEVTDAYNAVGTIRTAAGVL